jgi:hypothetical protein
MNEEMVGRFRHFLAKGTKPTIWPPPLLKPIGGPKAVLKGKPSMMLHLCGGPKLSTQLCSCRSAQDQGIAPCKPMPWCIAHAPLASKQSHHQPRRLESRC